MSIAFLCVVVLTTLSSVVSFMPISSPSRSFGLKMALDDNTLSKLEEMNAQYKRLSAADSPENDAEKAKIVDVVEKYQTLVEIKGMLSKLRSMWRTEASDRRRQKQLDSFVSLYKGRVEIEEIIKEKMGIPFSKEEPKLAGLDEVARLDAEIAALEEKLQDVELVLPSGMSTREARFGPLV